MNLELTKKDEFKEIAKELKPGTPLELVEAIRYSKVPNLPGKKDKEQIIEIPIVQSVLFTDGTIVKTDEVVKESNRINIEGIKEQKINIKKTKYVYLTNFTYAVVFLIAKEDLIMQNCGGTFDTVKNVSIYLNDKQDKKAIEKVRQVLKLNAKNSEKIDTSSVFSLAISEAIGKVKSCGKEVSKNIYLVKAKRKA